MALHILEQFEIDLVLLDIVMPELSGYDVIRKIRANHKTQDIPVVFLTGKDSPEDEKLGFELGAADYIHKPVSIPLLRSRVMRTQHYVRLLAEQLALLPKYQTLLTPKIVDTYFKAAPLHDIGKVGIVDSILLKPGKLTAEEFEEMKSHTTLGLLALEKAEKLSGAQNELISAAKEIAYGHHEKWDGSGYPNGYAGERIPLSARLMAIADVYDALRCKRVYKDPMSHEATRSIILEGNGTHFDPEVIDAFLAQEDMFIKIASEFADE